MNSPLNKFHQEYVTDSLDRSVQNVHKKLLKNRAPTKNLRLEAEIADREAQKAISQIIHFIWGDESRSLNQLAEKAAAELGWSSKTIKRWLNRESVPSSGVYFALGSILGGAALTELSSGGQLASDWRKKLSGRQQQND